MVEAHLVKHGPLGVVMVGVAALSGALLVIFLVGSTLAAWYDERVKRATAKMARGAALKPGYGTFWGVARSLDGRPDAVLVTRSRVQRWRGGPPATGWADVDHSVQAEGFALELEGGEELRIEGEALSREGFHEQVILLPPVPPQAPRCERIARLRAGDWLWATGVLSRPVEENAGAYRSGVARRVLRAPRGKVIELSIEAPIRRWQKRARGHRIGAFAALFSLGVAHGLFWRGLDVTVATGTYEQMGSLWRWIEVPPVFLIPGWMGLMVVIMLWREQLKKA